MIVCGSEDDGAALGTYICTYVRKPNFCGKREISIVGPGAEEEGFAVHMFPPAVRLDVLLPPSPKR